MEPEHKVERLGFCIVLVENVAQRFQTELTPTEIDAFNEVVGVVIKEYRRLQSERLREDKGREGSGY